MVRSMKELICLIVCLFAFSVSTFAQASESFDIVTFQPPKGFTKRSTDDAIQFSIEDKSTPNYCLVTLFKSTSGVGNSKENLNAAWQALVKETLGIPATPQVIPSDNKQEWQLEGSFAPFEKEGQKGVVLLYTISGYSKMVNVLILTNTLAYEPTVTAFIESISLKAPKPSAEETTDAGTDAVAIVGTWGITSSNQSQFAVNHGISGYISRQYTFNSNGTYESLIKTFQYTSAQLLFTKENGTYQLSGNTLTITPQKSFIQSWSKATVIGADGRRSETDDWGKLISTQNRRLERVTYQISKVYMSGTEKWQLRMQASTPNERDGPFNGGSSYPNTWLYETQRFPIDPPPR